MAQFTTAQASHPVPVVATGTLYATYLDAARTNLENMLKLAVALNDAEFAKEAKCILGALNDSSEDARELLDESAANAGVYERDGMHWRESVYADRAGLGYGEAA